jgi:hypothetical protein
MLIAAECFGGPFDGVFAQIWEEVDTASLFYCMSSRTDFSHPRHIGPNQTPGNLPMCVTLYLPGAGKTSKGAWPLLYHGTLHRPYCVLHPEVGCVCGAHAYQEMSPENSI